MKIKANRADLKLQSALFLCLYDFVMYQKLNQHFTF